MKRFLLMALILALIFVCLYLDGEVKRLEDEAIKTIPELIL